MEPEAAIPEGAWSSLDGMYTSEEADLIFMSQLLANCSVTNELNEDSSSGSFPFSVCPSSHEYSTTTTMEGIEPFSTVGSNENYYTSGSHQIMATNYSSDDFCLWEGNTTTGLFLKQGEECGMNQELSTGNVGESGRNQQGAAVIYEKLLQLKRESDDQMRIEVVPENCKKRSCSSVQVQMNKRNLKSKKSQKPVLSRNIEDINNAMASSRGQSSSSCCSVDDDSNASHDHDLISGGVSPKGVADLNLNCKTRARRGSATDSQSVYARKRREKINERLQILQNLVPNGTKVDISTMLEEAVQYVKFLQLQIKVLSSDDLWMYAPIVCNGIDMGMDLNS